jgi:hypothetical protein
VKGVKEVKLASQMKRLADFAALLSLAVICPMAGALLVRSSGRSGRKKPTARWRPFGVSL